MKVEIINPNSNLTVKIWLIIGNFKKYFKFKIIMKIKRTNFETNLVERKWA